ncbi:EamA family transporter, partial [Singulisphaera rosea]
ASLVATSWLAVRWRSISPGRFDSMTVLMLLGVGATGTVGQYFRTRAFASGSPAKVAGIGLSQVVFGMVFDMVFWGRSLTPIGLLGFALVLIPTAWMTSRPGRPVIPSPRTTSHPAAPTPTAHLADE